MMTSIDYGTISKLRVCDGAPDFGSEYHVEYDRLLKPSATHHEIPRKARGGLKAQILNLREICEQQRNILITELTVQGGLPHRIKFREES